MQFCNPSDRIFVVSRSGIPCPSHCHVSLIFGPIANYLDSLRPHMKRRHLLYLKSWIINSSTYQNSG